jgi:hypothetical protein
MLDDKLIRIELTSGRGLLLLGHTVHPFIGPTGMEIPGVEGGFGVDGVAAMACDGRSCGRRQAIVVPRRPQVRVERKKWKEPLREIGVG